MQELMTGKEVRAFLRISRRTLTYWVASKKLSSVKVGRMRRYRRSDVEAMLQS